MSIIEMFERDYRAWAHQPVVWGGVEHPIWCERRLCRFVLDPSSKPDSLRYAGEHVGGECTVTGEDGSRVHVALSQFEETGERPGDICVRVTVHGGLAADDAVSAYLTSSQVTRLARDLALLAAHADDGAETQGHAEAMEATR